MRLGEPGEERVAREVEAGKLPPRDEERLLRHLLGVGRIPDQAVREPVDGPDIGAVQRAESVFAPAGREGHERGVAG